MDGDQLFGQLGLEIIALLFCIVLFIIVLMLWSQLKTMRKKYMEMMNQTGIDNLQDVIIDMQQRLSDQQERGNKNSQTIQAMQEKIASMKGNLKMIRYNAFSDSGQGSDLSFSIAFLDDEKNGAVLTGIFGRDESYMYGKPVSLGESQYPLTPEEKEAIRLTGTPASMANKKKDSE
jgi:hypothetical protein